MANEIKNGRLHIDGQRIPLSMDEARSMKMNAFTGQQVSEEASVEISEDKKGQYAFTQDILQKKIKPNKELSYTEDEYKAAEDVYGRMRTAQSMAMDVLMPSDEEFKSLNTDAFTAVMRDVAEREAEAKRQERLKKAEELSSRVGEPTESPLAEYGIY